jgi:hypothetical protein
MNKQKIDPKYSIQSLSFPYGLFPGTLSVTGIEQTIK